MYKLTCEHCGRPFQSKKKTDRFCSKDCYIEHCKETGCLKGKSKVKKVEVVCAYCGKHELIAPSRAKRYVCCSKDCLAKYNAKRYSKKVELVCPICGDKYYRKNSKVLYGRYKTCSKPECIKTWKSSITSGSNNPRYKSITGLIKSKDPERKNKYEYRHIVKEHFGFNSTHKLPRNYDIHHKDANHFNNDPTNLVLLPRDAHMLVHRYFGNILLSALHTGKITRELFFSLCNDEQKKFYEQIIDLDITKQVVVKQGELLENLEEDDQQPSVFRNIYVGSETNSQVQTDNAVDSNADTSALLTESISDEEIVQTACITDDDEDADA